MEQRASASVELENGFGESSVGGVSRKAPTRRKEDDTVATPGTLCTLRSCAAGGSLADDLGTPTLERYFLELIAGTEGNPPSRRVRRRGCPELRCPGALGKSDWRAASYGVAPVSQPDRRGTCHLEIAPCPEPRGYGTYLERFRTGPPLALPARGSSSTRPNTAVNAASAATAHGSQLRVLAEDVATGASDPAIHSS